MGTMNGNYSGANSKKWYPYPYVRSPLNAFQQLPIGSTERSKSRLDGKIRKYVKRAHTESVDYWDTEDGMESQVFYFKKDLFCECNIQQQANFDLISGFYE